MFKLQIIAAFRSIINQKYYSLISILGLSIGLAAFTLIVLFVRHELSYDRYNSGAEDIYRLVRDEYTFSPPPMAPMLKAKIPEIQFSSRVIRDENILVGIGENYFTEDEYFWADNEFFKIFSFEFIRGDIESVLQNPSDVIISETFARKYFGDSDPMGKSIIISREHEYVVAGVFRDMPSNSHFRFNIVLPIERYFKITGSDPEYWGSNYVYSYVKLHRNTNIDDVNKKLVAIEKELTRWTPESGPYEQYFFFQPVTEIHLYSHRQQEVMVNGDIKNVYIFSSIGLLILIIAGINYVNLTTAMSGKRFKEVGVRKAMGAKKLQLIGQFLTESVIVALISTGIAILIVIYALPYFGNLMERNLRIGLEEAPLLIPFLLLLAIVVGLSAGLIPSRSVSGVSLTSVLKGSSGKGSGTGLRNALVIVQFSIALILIILSINVQRQLTFLIEKDPGYEKEQIITLRLFDESLAKNIPSIKQELLTKNNVASVSTSLNLPHKITGFRRPDWYCPDPDDCTPISYSTVDYNFVDLYDLEIVEGRNFSKDFPSDALGAYLINEKAAKVAGWESPIGMELVHYDGTKGKIVGVVNDFVFQSMHTEIAPLYILLDEKVYSHLSIKITGSDISKTLSEVQNVFDHFSPNAPFEYTFFDEDFARTYNSEKRLQSIFMFFSVLAILLGCLGLYGLTAYIINQKTKEIGVRKVLGATNLGISILLGRNFLGPVLLANLLAWPIAYWALNKWLESFAFRTNITIWSFMVSSVLVLVITIVTISLQGRKIASQTPTVSLRYE